MLIESFALIALCQKTAKAEIDPLRLEISQKLSRIRPGYTESQALVIVGLPDLDLKVSAINGDRLYGYTDKGRDFPLYGSFTVDKQGFVEGVYGGTSQSPTSVPTISLNELVADISSFSGIACNEYRVDRLLRLCDKLRKFSPGQVAEIFEEYLRVAPLNSGTYYGCCIFTQPTFMQNSFRLSLLTMGLLGENDLFDCNDITGVVGIKPSVFLVDDIPFVLALGAVPHEKSEEEPAIKAIRSISRWPQLQQSIYPDFGRVQDRAQDKARAIMKAWGRSDLESLGQLQKVINGQFDVD